MLLIVVLLVGVLALGLVVDRSVATTVRAQVIVFWGGGEQRTWDGSCEISVFGLRPAAVPSVWLADFEHGDRWVPGARMPPARQQVPSTLRGQQPPELTETLQAPLYGCDLHTRTDGDADGLYLLWEGARSADLTLDFEGTGLSVPLTQLLAEPVVLRVDDTGNHLVARAIDLDGSAVSTRPHHGSPAHLVSLHTHTSITSATVELESTMESLPPFVDQVWWTEHNTMEARKILGGDFEDPAVTDTYWMTVKRNAEVVEAGRVADAWQGQGAYRLSGTATGPQTGLLWTAVQQGARAGEMMTSLLFEPRLRFAWKPEPAGGRTPTACVQVDFASGRSLRYLSQGQGATTGRVRGLTLSSEPGVFTDHVRDLKADLQTLFPEARTDSIRRFLFGVFCPPGSPATAVFDELHLEIPDARQRLDRTQALLDTYPALRSYHGMEQTAWMGEDRWGALVPHLTGLFPAFRPDLLGDHEDAPGADGRREWVRRIQAAGGVVGTHHMQRDPHYTSFLADGGYGADLFEVGAAWSSLPAYVTGAEQTARDTHGYPRQNQDEVYPILVRWDRTTARGLMLTGYGAPDLNGRFDTPTEGFWNRWLSWVLADDATESSLLDGIRRGQVVGTEWFSEAMVTLEVDGLAWMGQVVASDRPTATVQARVSGALPGSRLRWIMGHFQKDTAGSDREEAEPAGARPAIPLTDAESSHTLEVEPGRGVFVRAELLNPTGHLVAFSNPVSFLPYWPDPWPRGKVAFDWQGHRLAGTTRLRLDQARVETDGALTLVGLVFDGGGSLALKAPGRPRLRGEVHAGTEHWDASTTTWTLRDIAPGPFQVTLDGVEPLRPPPRANLNVLPPRKETVKVLEHTAAAPDVDRFLEGFAEPVTGATLYHRRMDQQSASFQLALPAGEPLWIKIHALGSHQVTGRIEMEGEELDRFGADGPMTFAIPPQEPDGDAEVVRRFTIDLDRAPTPDAWTTLRVQGIQLFRGPGVVDY